MNDMKVFERVLTSFKKNPVLLGVGNISRSFKFLSDKALMEKKITFDDNHFYLLGTMGAELPMGLGLSLSLKHSKIEKIVVVQGDGGFLMSMGTLGLISHKKPKKLVVFIMDNKCYFSTGGQPAISKYIKIRNIIESFDLNVIPVDNLDDLNSAINFVSNNDGPHFVYVNVDSDPDKKIPPVTFLNPPVITHKFRHFLKKYREIGT
jgi:sulfopyruvate decarboxylase subunit beta